MQAASTGAMTSRAVPVAIFQRVAARVSWISGWGERFSKGRTSWAGRRRTAAAVERAGELAGGEDGLVEGFGGLVVGDEDERGGVARPGRRRAGRGRGR